MGTIPVSDFYDVFKKLTIVNSFSQEYDKASQLLSYALGMVNTVAGRGAVSSPLERVKAAIHQELLVLDICHESHTKRYLVTY